MSKDYTELLKAVDLIVSQRLNDVAFDKTLVCKIVNDENKSNGEYLVEYENMKMTAYALSETDEYTNGQEVYVTITQGDFNLKKIIIGSVKTSELPVYMYTNPLKNLVKLSAIPFTFGDVISPDINLRDYSAEGMPEIKYLAFGADFTTQLEDGETLTNSDYIKTYGIRITGKGILKINNDTKEDIDWVFDNTMFQGNPYNFNGKFRQEQLFNIQNYSKLINLKITFFNNLENKIKVEVSNCELYYGYATEDLTLEEDYDKIIIYEVDDKKQYPNTSDNQIPSLKIQTKRITQKSGSVVITEDFSDTEQFEWYVYYTGAQDVGNGKNWALIKEQNSKILDLSDNGKEFTLQINTEDEYAVKTKLPNNAIQKALQIMAKLKTSDTTKLTSNNLTFYRSDYDDLQEALKGSGIELSAVPQSFVYYGDSQKITTSNLSGNIAANLTGAAVWKPGVDVYWRIPLKGTMFENPFTIIGDVYYWNLSFFGAAFLSQISNGEEEVYNSSKRYKCKGTYKSEDGNYAIVQVTTEDSSTPSLPFRIKSSYVAGSTNNIIKCTVEYKDIDVGDVYDSISIGFDPYGTQGTDYTVGIVFDGDPFLSVSSFGSTTTCTLKAFLKDKDNNDITKQVGKLGTPFEKTAFEWNIEQDSIAENSIQFLEKTISDDNLTCTIKLKFITNETLLIKYNGIISLTLKDVLQTNGLEVTYKVFCPIPLHYCTTDSPLDIYSNIALPTEVKYNYDGTNPLYNKDSVTIDGFDIDNIELITNDVNKNCIELNKTNKSILINSLAPSIFPKATLKVEVEDSDVWYQPIAFYRNQYTSSLLNAWNGGLIIDDKGNKILTQILGAGVKNKNNTFSGVLMGAVGTETNDAVTGLYGYQDGELRFKFNEDGDAYIGKGSDNHIDFTNGNLDIAAKKFTLHTNNIYISDNPKDGKIVKFGEAFSLSKEGKVILNGDSDDAEISLSVRYAGSQSLNLTQDEVEDLDWKRSVEDIVKQDTNYNNWEDKYLYLWTRTRVAADSYNYSQQISSKAKIKTQYAETADAEIWEDSKEYITSNLIYYRKIRFIEGVADAFDVFEGPFELPQGKDGNSSYSISFDNDFDVLVRTITGSLINNTINIGIKYFYGDDEQENVETAIIVNSNSGVSANWVDENSCNQLQIVINEPSISDGQVSINWQNITKTFKFKIIDGTDDYELIVSPQVVNVDELNDVNSQNISIAIKDSKGNITDNWYQTEHPFSIQYTYNNDEWNHLQNNTNIVSFKKDYETMGIRLYYREGNKTILLDEEWVQAVYNGPAGTSPYTISLDNDFETVVKNNRTNLTNKTIVVKPTAYYGSEIATGVAITPTSDTIDENDITGPSEDGDYTISGLNKLDLNTVYSVNFELTKNDDTSKTLATKTFKFQIIEMEKDYHLKIDTQVINISQNTTKTIQLQVVSGSTVYTKPYSDTDASDSSMALPELEIYNTLDNELIQTWENYELKLNQYSLDNLPKFELRWKLEDSSSTITIDIEEIALVVNGSDSTTSLTNTSIVYFDSGEELTKYEENSTKENYKFTDLSTAVNHFKNNKVLKNITGYVGIVTKSTYSNNIVQYTNYSYESYQNFVLNNTQGVIIDGNTSSAVIKNILTRSLGTDLIMSSNYTSNGTGMKINLNDGSIDSKYFKIDSVGNITATAGVIGGWEIKQNTLGNAGISAVRERCSVGIAPSIDTTTMEILKTNDYDGQTKGLCFWAGAVYVKGCNEGYGGQVRLSTAPFRVYGDGSLYASKGKIGSWNMDSSKLWKSTVWSGEFQYGTGMSATSFENDPAFYAGFAGNGGNPWNHASSTTKPDESKDWKKYTKFYVLNNGTLYASNATIKGTLQAGSVLGDNAWKMANHWLYAKKLEGVDTVIPDDYDVCLGAGGILTGTGVNMKVKLWTDITGSDRAFKENITEFSEQYDTFFNNLKPCRFNYNNVFPNGNPKLVHFGFIAQDIMLARNDAQLENLALIGIHSKEYYGLYLEEFIALNTWQIQKLKIRVAELEAQLAEIKEKLQ